MYTVGPKCGQMWPIIVMQVWSQPTCRQMIVAMWVWLRANVEANGANCHHAERVRESPCARAHARETFARALRKSLCESPSARAPPGGSRVRSENKKNNKSNNNFFAPHSPLPTRSGILLRLGASSL